MKIWEEKDNIDIYSNFTYVIYTDMPRTRSEKKKNSSYKDELASEPASELYPEKRGGAWWYKWR